MNSFDLLQAYRPVIGFGRSREYGSEADIVSAFVKSADCLVDAVSRFPHHAIGPGDLSRFGDRKIILPDMDTFRWHNARDFGVIIDDERDTACKCDVVQVGSQVGDLSRGVRFGAELYQIDASIDHLFSHPPSLNGIYITQVQDTVEPAAT